MSNLPSQPRQSHPQSPSDSWHTVPSAFGETASEHNNSDLESSAEFLVDLNPTNPLAQSQDSSDTSSGVLVTREKKKCWICLAEEDERTPEGSPVNASRWSKACACSLDAHESCLITWINQSRGADTNKIMSCPQCKEPYRLQQKTSSLYKLATYYNKRIDKIAPFVAGLGALGGAYVALTVHGWYSLVTFCGEDLAFRLFSDENWRRPAYVIRMLFGMQFIPVWLLASRTKYLDSVLPFIPLVFIEQDNVALLPHPRVTLFPMPRYETLPPALTMCVIPWLRIVYNKLWEKLVVPWEKKWEDSVANTGPANIGWRDEEENLVLHIVDDNGNRRENAQAAPGGNNANRRLQQAEDVEDVLLATNLTTLCRKIVGALLMPDICAFAGFLLGQLPWVRRKIPDRFSRNVIGGIVFLLLKDAASVWYKYSAIKSRRSLRILDYDARGGRARAGRPAAGAAGA